MPLPCIEQRQQSPSAKKAGLLLCILTCFAGVVATGFAATLTVQTNRLGPTPSLLAYNSGHFYPGSNTREWWRYSGVNGARIFLSPANIEPSDDIAPLGDGVNSEATFLERRAAIRTNQFNPAYIRWTVFETNYQNNDLAGNNHILVNNAFEELRTIGVTICAQITASQSRFPLASRADWPNVWELWQHYYAQAFYLGRRFDVERYQMYNEPNHPNAGGLTQENFLLRLQVVSDAVQVAIEDVNRLYGKNLKARILAPVTAGSAQSSFDWGAPLVANRHTNFLGQFDPAFSLIHVYDYHQYNSTPAGFGSSLVTLNGLLSNAMIPEPRYPTAISEFNTHTGATFDTMTETLDSPTEYPRFGAICVNLMANACDELYCFKFSQTASSNPNYPVQKNAMHYVENTSAPYNVGGITKAGEVWRLFTKAFKPGRHRLGTVPDASAGVLDVHASYDPVEHCYYLFSANNTASSIPLTLNATAWNLPPGNRVLVEEVSEVCHGAGRTWTSLSTEQTLTLIQGAWSVLLFSLPARPQQQKIVPASDDAEVRDGFNRGNNYGTAPAITVRNDPANAANRGVGLIRFQLPTNDLSGLQLGLLAVQASSTTMNTTVQAHVYGLTNTAWTQTTVRWSNAPNLKQTVPVGATITQTVVTGLGTNASLVGQLVVNSTNTAEKLLDVTAYLRQQTSGQAAFLVSQDPRWNLALPSLEPGDVQSDGLRIISTEGGNAPRLILVFPPEVTPPESPSAWFLTNLPAATECFIRGGANATLDQDEATTGYLMVKFNPAPFDTARKAYFQFDLSGLQLASETQAVFTVTTHVTNNFVHRTQLWGLEQPYPDFSSQLSWANAQANDTTSNDLLISGPFTAARIGPSLLIPAATDVPRSFPVPNPGAFLHQDRITLVLTGADDAQNNAGGLRLQRASAVLSLLAAFPPPLISGLLWAAGRLEISFQGQPGQTYRVEEATNLVSPQWTPVATNVADASGAWSYSTPTSSAIPARFYRGVLQP